MTTWELIQVIAVTLMLATVIYNRNIWSIETIHLKYYLLYRQYTTETFGVLKYYLFANQL